MEMGILYGKGSFFCCPALCFSAKLDRRLRGLVGPSPVHLLVHWGSLKRWININPADSSAKVKTLQLHFSRPLHFRAQVLK